MPPVKLGFPLLKDRGENKQMFETTTYLDTLGVFSYWASGSESKSNSGKKQNCDVSKVSPWFFDSFCWGTRICKPEKNGWPSWHFISTLLRRVQNHLLHSIAVVGQ